MDARAERLLRRLVEIETGEAVITTYLGGGRTATERRPHATVAEFLPERGVVVIEHDGVAARLQLDEAELLHVLTEVAGDASEVWGREVPDDEAAARLLSVWLDECLATREPHPSGWWTLRNCWFHPLPPWEAPRDR
ncbi:hypothetical protein [Blastococcus brunescens]|uniref:Uncharacterized protein n=1 Tax=Blastococcus brunescens TaxID=1564165 RepID=A0ABZ1AZ31_9ACTN|nr:hypothetical protein [Blastococcus sp. BMG 8361]WRL62746.1 hypothetical protein U6N30_22940 [Blastococcus sp. BMG 8361]